MTTFTQAHEAKRPAQAERISALEDAIREALRFVKVCRVVERACPGCDYEVNEEARDILLEALGEQRREYEVVNGRPFEPRRHAGWRGRLWLLGLHFWGIPGEAWQAIKWAFTTDAMAERQRKKRDAELTALLRPPDENP